MLQTSDAPAVAVLIAATVTAAVIDVRTRRVPNVLTMSLALVGLTMALVGIGRVGVMASVAGCLVGLAVMLPGHLLGATGGGDVKLLAAAGTLLGPGATFRAFVATAIAGGVIALVVALRRRRLAATLAGTASLVASAGSDIAAIRESKQDNRFAYAPAIAIGAIVAALI
jgi:prepilin peptidase CpaA